MKPVCQRERSAARSPTSTWRSRWVPFGVLLLDHPAADHLVDRRFGRGAEALEVGPHLRRSL
jgi:hypothetical protein